MRWIQELRWFRTIKMFYFSLHLHKFYAILLEWPRNFVIVLFCIGRSFIFICANNFTKSKHSQWNFWEADWNRIEKKADRDKRESWKTGKKCDNLTLARIFENEMWDRETTNRQRDGMKIKECYMKREKWKKSVHRGIMVQTVASWAHCIKCGMHGDRKCD